MALQIKGNGNGNGGGSTERHLPKEGARPARLTQVYDLGTQQRDPYKGEAKDPCRMVVLGFDLVDDVVDFGGDIGKAPIRVNTGWFFPLTVTFGKNGEPHEKSNLRKYFNAIDPSNSKDFDLEAMLGMPCILTIKHNESKGNTYANIVDRSPVPDMDGFTVAETSSPLYSFDFYNHTKEEWDQLPEFIQKKMEAAIDFNPNRFD